MHNRLSGAAAEPTALAFLWHLHQPSYLDPRTGEPVLPWVRLHASRAYYDLPWLLARYPRQRATINVVPVLLSQLEKLVGGAQDEYARLSRKNASDLSADERRFLAQQFFSVSRRTEIEPRPRYRALLTRRERDPEGQSFSVEDLRDLQLLFNLAWMGFAAREEFPELAALEAKGQHYSEADKQRLLDIQAEVAARVLPLWRRLAAEGQIELTTTPARHPILPLIIDTEHAARCQPHKPRPPRFAWPQDAQAHVQRAMEAHKTAFGERPVGCWPAEGSVSPEAVQILAAQGVGWLASDEAQLFGSLPAGTDRRALYQPFRVRGSGLVGQPEGEVDFVFRDRNLSDRIGFTYAHNPPEAAVADLLGLVRAAKSPRPGQPALVVAALDGENPWEYYADSGRAFLEQLYTALDAAQDVQTVRMRDYLAAHPPTATLPTLHTGSWIHGDFTVWIGGQMENRAWGYLGAARQLYAQKVERPHPQDAPISEEAARRAYDHLLDAESSDWFWWYGEPFSSDNDLAFDALFRGHLRQVYRLLGETVPDELYQSLYPVRAQVEPSPPRGRVSPRYDGRSYWQDWLEAGELKLGGSGGSMYRAGRWFERLRYGFDEQGRLALRFEPARNAEREALDAILQVQLTLQLPEAARQYSLRLRFDAHGQRAEWVEAPEGARLGAHQGAVEIGLPVPAEAQAHPIELVARVLLEQVERERLPAQGSARLLPQAAGLWLV